MKTRSMLISFPGYRFSLRTLLPSHRLAALAGCLEEAGHVTEIRDYGIPDTLDRLFPRQLQATAQTVADRFLGDPASGALSTFSALWQLRSIDRTLRARLETRAAEIAAELAATEGLHFVGLEVDRPEALRGTLAMAGRLRALAPSTRIVAVGRFVEEYGEALAHATDAFDCFCIGDAEWSVTQWAERLDRPDTWRLIPNLVCKQHGYIRPATECVGLDLDSLPAPVYRDDVYPALADGGKLRLLSVEVSRGKNESVRTKSPRTVCDETNRLVAQGAVRAFRFLGSAAPPSHMDAVAYEILSRGLTVWYCRDGAIHDTKPKSFSVLKASGCQALSFEVNTGSQWLLEDYYHRGFGVTEVEQVLRACKLSGIFTITRFTYPCPSDDYHTRAETLRLVDRTRPHAARVELPVIASTVAEHGGSVPRQFDFGARDYVNHIASGRDRFALPILQRRVYPHRGHARSLSDMMRAHEVLRREMEGMGVCTVVSEEAALVARVCGYEGHEYEFGALLRQRLFTGDAGSVAAAVERFNARVATLANTVAFRNFEPVLAAVGN